MHAKLQRPRLSWIALALLATSTLLSGGCAKLYHTWHYNGLTRSIYEHRLSYYQSPHTGRIIPKEHHGVYGVELPCFGFESTCWHRWPEECVNCPVQGASSVVVDGSYSGKEVIQEEVIEQPNGAGSPEAIPADDDAAPTDDFDDVLEDTPLPTDDVQWSPSPEDDSLNHYHSPQDSPFDEPKRTEVAMRPTNAGTPAAEAESNAADAEVELDQSPDAPLPQSRTEAEEVSVESDPFAEFSELDVERDRASADDPVDAPADSAHATSDLEAGAEPAAGLPSMRSPLSAKSSRRVRPAGTLSRRTDLDGSPSGQTPTETAAITPATHPHSSQTGVIAHPAVAVRSELTASRPVSTRRPTTAWPREVTPSQQVSLPSFTIKPVLPPATTAPVASSVDTSPSATTSVQVDAQSEIRFLPDGGMPKVRVADQSPSDTALRFR